MSEDTQKIKELLERVEQKIAYLDKVIEQRNAEIARLNSTAGTEGKMLVTSSALRAVLDALLGPSYYIRELLATREPPELFPENPINLLITEYNAVHAAGGPR